MNKATLFSILLSVFLLCGCSADSSVVQTEPPVTVTEPVIEITDPDAIVAQVGDETLTCGELQVWYWAEIASHQQSGLECPDFHASLDSQPCTIDDSAGTWHQYFLNRALTAWHSAQALALQGAEEGVPTEEAFRTDKKRDVKYMEGMPVTKVLYGYWEDYRPNSMHQAYLDTLPDTLNTLAQEKGYSNAVAMAGSAFGARKSDLLSMAQLYNHGYMYFTTLSYGLDVTQEELDADPAAQETNASFLVDIRQILLAPGSEEEAHQLLNSWLEDGRQTEAEFADLARKQSEDAGSVLQGGSYLSLTKGQLIPELDSWCFDEARQPGDTAVVQSKYGWHILYFSQRRPEAQEQVRQRLLAQKQSELIRQARDRYPLTIHMDAVSLAQAEGTVTYDDLLYPDIAHERFPEVPLYLQQNYTGTRYGDFDIVTNGCGITTFAMLSSYLTDEEWTPPELCAKFGRYSKPTGTDGSMFSKEPAGLGFYLVEKVYDWRIARDYMEDGHIVVVVQHKGYWTRGGHYLLLETLSEDGRVQVRDSNLFNYARLSHHKEDLFDWDLISPRGMGYWIYEKKVTSTPSCCRCGNPEGAGDMLLADYTCEKCEAALLRRSTYLS